MTNDPADVVIAFLNTVDVEDGTDLMSDLDEWDRWVRSTMPVEERQTRHRRDQARELRTYLRGIVAGEPAKCPSQVPVAVELGGNGARLTSETVVGAIAAAAATLSIARRWDRIKICPADDCRWAFYDASRNHSRQWCSMQVCGNRAKVRKFRDGAPQR